MSKFLNGKYNSLKVYTPGEQPRDKRYIKLNTNESPYPPSKGVIRAVSPSEIEKLRLYPDPECTELKEKIAALYGVKRENIYLSNGSDDILYFAFMAFGGESGPIRFPEISYGFYQVFADLLYIDCLRIPLREDFTIDCQDYCGGDGMVVIANPNAPTGLALTREEIRPILDSNRNRVVLIDEAYIDFGGQSCVPLTAEYDNLLVVQTFSKSRSMAGARLGFAIADQGLIEDLNRIKYSTNPYNINRLTMAAAQAAVEENEYYIEKCREIQKTRQYTQEQLESLDFEVIPSLANFVFAKSRRIGGESLYLQLKERGVLVRHFQTEKIKDYNRITIGTKEEMDILLDKIREILKEQERGKGNAGQ